MTDCLEDQIYFHGVIPRPKSIVHLKYAGDYLVRKNDDGQIVLSVLWYDDGCKERLKDGHFIIFENNKVEL